jgi:hypothetical protein
VTNSVWRRTQQHREAEVPGFTADLQMPSPGLV